MTLSIVTRQVTFGDQTSGPAYFATDGTNFWPISVLADSSGALIVDTSGIPISAAVLPLPTGAATAANQPTAAAQGSSTASQTGLLSQGAVTSGAPAYTNSQTSPLSLTTMGALRTDASATTQPISVASLPLPAGAATAAGVAAINTTLGTPMQQTGGFVTANAGTNLNTSSLAVESGGNLATIATIVSSAQGSTTAGQRGPLIQGAVTAVSPTYTTAQTNALSLTTSGALRIDGTAVTQPISAALLPLPTGAATSANQPTSAAQGSTTSGQTGRLVQGAVTAAAPSYTTAQTSPLSLTTSGALRIDGSGATQPVSAASLPLPAGAAQDGTDATGITQLAGGVGIRGWLSGIFNKLSTSIAVTGTFWQATQPISAASLPLPAGAAQDGTDGTGITPPTGATGIRGWLSAIYQGVTASVAAGTAIIGKVGFDPANNVISATSLPLPAGAATSANQPSNIAKGAASTGDTGTLAFAEVLTNAGNPANTTTVPLNADNAGHLRVARGHLVSSATPVVTSNGVYTAGKILGTLLSYSVTPTASKIEYISVTAQSSLTANLTAYIFWQNPTASTWTDNTTPNISTADKLRILKAVPLTNPNNGLGTHTVWDANNLGLDLNAATFFVLLVATQAVTLTSSSTSDIVVRVGLET